MIKDKCISVTDLRKNTSKVLKDLEKWKKYIFLNNRPVGVVLWIDEYERLKQNYSNLSEKTVEKLDVLVDDKENISEGPYESEEFISQMKKW